MLLQFTNSHPGENNGSVSGAASTALLTTVILRLGLKAPAFPPSPQSIILRCREVEKRFEKVDRVPQLCWKVFGRVRIARNDPRAKVPSPPLPVASYLPQCQSLRRGIPDWGGACGAS